MTAEESDNQQFFSQPVNIFRREAMAEGTKCPKCGYVRKKDELVPDWQCPACQVVYAKAQPAALAAGEYMPQQTAESISTDRQVQEMRDNQNLLLGIAAGLAAALVGAFGWAWFAVLTDYKIGWFAIGIGALVGFAMRFAGNGTDAIFRISGATISLIGCVLGNFLIQALLFSRQNGIPFFDLLSLVDSKLFFDVLKESFDPMDALFYGLATWAGYQYSAHKIE
jgi:rubredoxin